MTQQAQQTAQGKLPAHLTLKAIAKDAVKWLKIGFNPVKFIGDEPAEKTTLERFRDAIDRAYHITRIRLGERRIYTRKG